MSYGGLAAGGNSADYNNGGYQIRVFRSANPDGSFVDSKNDAALYNDKYYLNFGAGENDGNRGTNIFGCYSEWGKQTVGNNGERSQGHNSAIAAPDGRAYLVYHTRFQSKGEAHEVRVHQLFQNEDGWLVAAPFEYTGELATTAKIATKQYVATNSIPGKYKLLTHKYGLDHMTKAYATPVDVVLDDAGNVTGGFTGKWVVKDGTSYFTINGSGQSYKGVMVVQTLEPSNERVPSFTLLNSSTGETMWGYKVSAQ